MKRIDLNPRLKKCTNSTKILTITLFLLAEIMQLSAQNLISNSGFEEWNDSKPINWYGDKTTFAQKCATQCNIARSDNYSLKLINPSTDHKRYTPAAYKLDVTQNYLLTYYIKGKGSVRNTFYDKEQTSFGFCAYPDYTLINSNDWVMLSYSFKPGITTTSGTLDVEIVFSVKQTDETEGLLIDDVSLVATSSTAINHNTSVKKLSFYYRSKDDLSISATSPIRNVTLYSTTGVEMATVQSDSGDKEITIPVKKITSGLYVAVVKLQDGTIQTIKLIKP